MAKRGVDKKHIADFRELGRQMNLLLRRIKHYCPEADIIMGETQLMLFSGPTYDGDEPLWGNLETSVDIKGLMNNDH